MRVMFFSLMDRWERKRLIANVTNSIKKGHEKTEIVIDWGDKAWNDD